MRGTERSACLGTAGRQPVADGRLAAGVSVAPASQVQRQFWLLHQLAPQSPAYHMVHAFRLRGRLDVAALTRSLEQLVARHEAFRTTFTVRGQQLLQVIAPAAPLALTTVDRSGDAAPDGPGTEATVEHLLAVEATRPFDLSTGPLLRVLLLRQAPQEHVLMVVMHHIITDLQTSQQLLEEWSGLYEATLTSPASPRPSSGPPYADYARWEQSWLATEEFGAMLGYWEQQLRGQEGLLALPTDRPRPAVPSFAAGQVPVELSGTILAALQRSSRQAGLPLFVTLLSAYAVLLHRYTRQTSLVVGVPFTNRRRKEFQHVMGCFVNILPVVIDLSGGPSFRELLQRVRQTMLEAHRRQEVTLERIVERLKLSRDLSHNPLYQVGFTFSPAVQLRLAGVAVEALGVPTGAAQLDLFLLLWESEGAVRGGIEYRTDLFEAATVERLAGHYGTLLAAIAQDLDRPIAALEILPDSERMRLVHEWNATEMPCPQVGGIHQLFEAQACETPDAVAVEFEGSQLTYGELNRRANQLAHSLQALGIGPDVLVGVYMERSLEMLIGLLGILKAGGAYLPVDPEFPKKRIDYMLDHSQVAVLLTQERMKEPLGRTGATMICLDRDWEAISQQSDQNPPCTTRPEHLAYVIYTSGSTGDPKGVQIPHRAVVNFLASMRREPGITADDVLLAVTTLSFDISVLELFLPLTVGAKTVIASREVASDGGRILEAMDRHGVTMMQATPATWRLMTAAGWKSSGGLKVLCGGEALSQDLAGDLLRRAAEVWNMYGPTETTVWSTCYRLTDPEGPILIGRPIANTQIYILDGLLQPVPIGVPGEIYIGGVGVTRGYLKAPELTAERFVPHPFDVEDVQPSPDGQKAGGSKARVYKTGDFGRYRPDGNIEFLGRLDQQVKVRGFRIEMGEIEAVLAQHVRVEAAAVATREDGFGNVRLIGYLVPAPGDPPTVESLREFLQDRLPYYMVPELYVILESLPLTPNGKVDRKRLPEPDYARPQMKQAYVAPSTGYEQTLSEIWCHVLGLDRVGVHDNFFDLGGNSLLGVQAIVHMRQKLDIAVPIIKLFQCPTIASLAKCLDRDDDDSKPIEDIESRAQRRRAMLSRRGSSPKLSPNVADAVHRGLS